MRIRRAQCPLCRKYNHKPCISGKVLLIKPISDMEKRQQSPPKRLAMNLPVCPKCETAINLMRKFAAFRQSWEKQRKVDIFYALFTKLKANIEESLNCFGLLVKSFVEHEFQAKQSVYTESQTCYQTLAALFDSLTKAIKRLVETKFETRRDELVASGMRNALAEWVMERMSQFRALEGQWKKVKVSTNTRESVGPVLGRNNTTSSLLGGGGGGASMPSLVRSTTAPVTIPNGRPPPPPSRSGSSSSKEPTPQASPRPGVVVVAPAAVSAKSRSISPTMSMEPLNRGERLGGGKR